MKKTFLIVSVYLFFSCITSFLYARDINLDAVYINAGSPYYIRLLEKKIEAYQTAGSQFIESGVIFACWSDGINIVYVKEAPQINLICSYNRSSRQVRELFRLVGTITAVRISPNGRYLFLKRIRGSSGDVPRGETLVLDMTAKTAKSLESAYAFIDFSVSPAGNSILFDTSAGIVEYFPESGERTLVLRRADYADLVRTGDISIAYLAPNRKKMMITCGSGGSYRSKIIAAGRSWPLNGSTSAGEISWIDNNRIAYRTGYAGNYSISIHDTITRRSAVIMGNSLNTGMQYSEFPKMMSMLKEQVINLYDVRRNDSVNTGLEGDDVSFSPDGNRFISLYLKRLFITGSASAQKKNIGLMKVAREILSLYQTLNNSNRDHANEYSRDYIKRKIAVYRTIAD